MTQEPAILPLVQKQARRITCAEDYAELQVPFGSDRLQAFAGIANDERRWLTTFAFCRNKARKDTSHREVDPVGPGLEIFQQLFASQHSFERDQHVAAEALNPAIFNRAKAVCVGTL